MDNGEEKRASSFVIKMNHESSVLTHLEHTKEANQQGADSRDVSPMTHAGLQQGAWSKPNKCIFKYGREHFLGQSDGESYTLAGLF